jgi:MFS family permease
MSTHTISRQLFYLFLCNLAIVFIGMGLFPILPLYAMAFGASPAMSGLFMASTYTAISVGSISAGWLGARLGRKRLFVGAGLISLPAVFLLGQVTALWQVVVLTAVLWLTGGIGLTMSNVFTGLIASSNKRGKAFGLLHLASPLGALLGGITVSRLLAWQGYPFLFAVLTLVWAVWPAVALLVVERPATAPAAKDGDKAGATAVSFSRSFYLLLGITLLATVAISISRLGTSFAMQALSFSTADVASTTAVSGLVTMPVVYYIGLLSDRLGRRRFLSLGYLLAAAGALSLIFSSQLWHFWLGAILLLIARTVSNSMGAALATDILQPEELERGLAWLTTTSWMSGVVAFAGAGQLFQTLGPAGLYLLVAGMALVAALQLRRVQYRAAPIPVAASRSITRPRRLALRPVSLWRLVGLVGITLLLSGCLAAITEPDESASPTPPATAVSSPIPAAPTATPTVVPEPTATATPDPVQPERLTFPPGSSTLTRTGEMAGQTQKIYLLAATAGQVVQISVTTPDNSVLFHLHGQADGVDYKHLLDGEMSWQGLLPIAQDYVLTLDALGDGERSYILAVTLDP